MADQNQGSSGGQGQGPPAGGSQAVQTTPQGLMGLANVQPSGTEYKSYEPVSKPPPGGDGGRRGR